LSYRSGLRYSFVADSDLYLRLQDNSMNSIGGLGLLRAHPKAFLKNYYLNVGGSGLVGGAKAYHFGSRGELVGCFSRKGYKRLPIQNAPHSTHQNHNTRNFRFTDDAGDFIGTHVDVPVWYIHVDAANTVAFNAINSVQVQRVGGPDIVVTTLLTGCTFCVSPEPGFVHMAHIQPGGGINHTTLANNVTNGHFALQVGHPTVFGSGHGYNPAVEDVTIVGVREGNQWKVYAQFHNRLDRYNLSVTNVVKFFHG
jgi:hypothetical protein